MNSTILTTSPMLVEKNFSDDAFEARILYPEKVKPGQEIFIEIHVKAKNDYMLSAIVIRAYPHTILPGPSRPILVEEAEPFYENSTEFSPPIKKFSGVYRIKFPEDLGGLGVIIFITPIKLGEPMVVHFSEPIIINIEVEGITPESQLIMTKTFPIITTTVKLPPKPWSNLSLSTDKEVYRVGEPIKITLTNKGSKVVRIKPSIPWVVCPYDPEENWINYFCVYEPPRDDKWITLEPGKSITWIWTQTSTWGYPVKPGHYAVVLGQDIFMEVNGETIHNPGKIEKLMQHSL